MSTEGYEIQKVTSVHLPPRETWLHDPIIKQTKLETPVDDRGLVDVAGLISLMKSTVAPDYKWDSTFTDIHHLQWPDRWYPKAEMNLDSPHIFRNLAVSKLIVPRVFHNWVHRITEPPEMPSMEVMEYRI